MIKRRTIYKTVNGGLGDAYTKFVHRCRCDGCLGSRPDSLLDSIRKMAAYDAYKSFTIS